MLVSGNLNLNTYNELTEWVKSNKEVTGNLMRIDFTDLTNIEASPNFKKLSSPKILKDELVIAKSALKLVTDINSKAKKQKNYY